MADQDRYPNDDNRDRLGQRDVYMDNRTGIGAQNKGYRAEWGRGRDEDRQRYGSQRGEDASFRDRDSGPGRDDQRRYGGGSGDYRDGGRGQNYTQGNRYGTTNPSYSSGYGGAGRQYERNENWQSYPARSNPDFYADENGSAGPGWTEDFSGRDREGYRGENRYNRRNEGGPGYRADGRSDSRSYEADYENRDRHDRGESRGWWDKAADKVAAWFGADDSSPYETRTSHRGKGPKNYRRSDDRVRDDVSDRMSDDHWLDASDIEVAAKDGEVTLTGMVKTRDDKRRAEQLAEQVSGVDNVQNNLRVQKPDEWRSGNSAATGRSTYSDPTTTEFGSTSAGTTTSNMGDIGTPNTVRSGKTTQ